MKKVFVVLTSMVIAFIWLLLPVSAEDVPVTFEWDPYTAQTETKPEDVAEILIYQRDDGGVYDYNTPIETVQQSVNVDGESQPVIVSTTITYPDNAKTKYHFVARAKGINDEFSVDSNEVFKEMDLTAILAINNLTATYNASLSQIQFTWDQTDTARVTSWKLYQSQTSGGPYTELATVPWDGSSTTITADVPLSHPAGQDITYYFVVVAFGDGINSADSNEVSVRINEAAPGAVINLRVNVQ